MSNKEHRCVMPGGSWGGLSYSGLSRCLGDSFLQFFAMASPEKPGRELGKQRCCSHCSLTQEALGLDSSSRRKWQAVKETIPAFGGNGY